jgi:hypothetical protein
MDSMIEIVKAAEREVLAHTIESTRGLHAYFCLHGGEAQVQRLQQEAVLRGLYRDLAERYTECLGGVLSQAAIASLQAGSTRMRN